MAKANLVYAHLADQVFQSEGGKMNIIGVFAGVGAPGAMAMQQFPGIYPRLALALGLSTTEKELPLTITFRNEDGKDVVPPFSGSFQIDRQASKTESANLNLNLNFDAFQVEKPGKLFLTVESGDDELVELEVGVVQAEQQQK